MAIKVKLRTKQISGNRESLYLDFYPAIRNDETGELTRRQFLGLFLVNEIEHETHKYVDENGRQKISLVPVLDKKGEPKKRKLSPIDKEHNRETLQLAQQIRQKKENQLNKPEIYSEYERDQLRVKEREEKSFIEYFKLLMNKRKASNHDNWVSAFHYLEKYTDGNLSFGELDETFCSGFKEFLLTSKSNRSSKTTLSQNSAVSYFNKLKAALKQAYKDGYLQTNLNARVESIKQAETKRNFLTMEELNILAKTECTIPELKKAALFSAMTGLRFSDIKKLTWGEIEKINGQGYLIHFKQQKTKGVEIMPVSDQAIGILGAAGKATDTVFTSLHYSAHTNQHLFKWLVKAGINKDITFHCFRHTFATLQLSKGTDIYTVSKMLGHRELKTTQIYAKIIDQTKREAANKILLDI